MEGKESDFFNAHPSTAKLVIEVAISSAALDHENASLYAEAGVEKYWIVLGEAQQIEVYRKLVNGTYREKLLYRLDQEVQCASPSHIHFPIAQVFSR